MAGEIIPYQTEKGVTVAPDRMAAAFLAELMAKSRKPTAARMGKGHQA